MSELEDQLRAAVTSRTQGFTPSADLPERIHARVRHHQRRRQVAATGILSTAAAVVVAVGMVLAQPPEENDDVVAEGRRTTSTSQPSPTDTDPDTPTSATPSTTATGETLTTGPTGDPTSQPPTDEPPDEPTNEPPDEPSGGTSPSSTTPTTTQNTITSGELKAPDSQQPAAGTCAQPSATVVEVVINPDIPSPRCTRVTAQQRLRVRNNTNQQVTVSLAGFSRTLAPGASASDDRAFGSYLQPGVHRVTVSIYGGSGPEIWLQ